MADDQVKMDQRGDHGGIPAEITSRIPYGHKARRQRATRQLCGVAENPAA